MSCRRATSREIQDFSQAIRQPPHQSLSSSFRDSNSSSTRRLSARTTPDSRRRISRNRARSPAWFINRTARLISCRFLTALPSFTPDPEAFLARDPAKTFVEADEFQARRALLRDDEGRGQLKGVRRL